MNSFRPFRIVAVFLCLVAIVNRSPAMGMLAESRVAKLDALVHLTPAQKEQAATIFTRENDALVALAAADRPLKGMEVRVASRAQIRALLTPEQRKIYDISPQTQGGGAMVNPEAIVDRLDQAVGLTADQKKAATKIIWDEFMNQVAAEPADAAPKGFMWRQPTKDALRALLTAEQQKKFDAAPPPFGHGPRPSH